MPALGERTDWGEISNGSGGLVPYGLCGALGEPRPFKKKKKKSKAYKFYTVQNQQEN